MTLAHKQKTGKKQFSEIWHLNYFEAHFSSGQAQRADMPLHFT